MPSFKKRFANRVDETTRIFKRILITSIIQPKGQQTQHDLNLLKIKHRENIGDAIKEKQQKI